MSLNYVYSGNAELFEILQNKIPVLTTTDPIFDLMPIKSVDADMVKWDQRGDYVGFMMGRSPDGGYNQIVRQQDSQFSVSPAMWGAQLVISEKQLLSARNLGTWGEPVSIAQQQGLDQDYLINQAIDAMRYMGWTLFTTGAYSVMDDSGKITSQGSFNLTPYTFSIALNSYATAKPIWELSALRNTREKTGSISCGPDSQLFMNPEDVSDLLANTNPNDLGARLYITDRQQAEPMSLDAVNKALYGHQLPQIVRYNEWYKDSSGTPQWFIPRGTGVLVAKRKMNDPVAEFHMTLNASNASAPGSPSPAKDPKSPFKNIYYDFEFKRKPPKGISTMSFNGAPAFYFPNAIIPINFGTA